jgi:hypothetical protein
MAVYNKRKIMAVGDSYNLDANGNYRYANNEQTDNLQPATSNSQTEADKAKQWIEAYLRSKKFEERLNKTIQNEGMNPKNAANYGHLMRKAVQDANVEYVDGFFDNIGRVLQGQPSITHSHYRDRANTAYIYGPEVRGQNVGAVTAHELGHTVGSVFAVPPRQAETIRQLQRPGANNSHVQAPEEARGDVYGIRYLANQLGVYNANTEDFTAKHLTALQNALQQRGIQDTQLNRMINTYGPDGLIRLMNMIAKQENNTIPNNYA